jgi:hypothetical protein
MSEVLVTLVMSEVFVTCPVSIDVHGMCSVSQAGREVNFSVGSKEFRNQFKEHFFRCVYVSESLR